MSDDIRELDTVALTTDRPEHGLLRGEMGAVVLVLAPGVFEVEFVDDDGQTYAMVELAAADLLPIRSVRKRAA